MNNLARDPTEERRQKGTSCRQQFEEERKLRIFNPRTRIFGTDVRALQQQIEEKNFLRAEEKRRDERFANEAFLRDSLLLEKEKSIELERRRKQEEIRKFNSHLMRKECNREADMNSSNYLKYSLPARISDNDIRLSISGAQKFMGEDLADSERRRLQIQQQKAWLDQQIAEKQQNEMDSKKADQLVMEALKAQELRAMRLETEQQHIRRKQEEAIARYNQKLSTHHEIKKLEADKQDEEDNLAEMYNILTSDMMTENKDCRSNLGCNRIIASKYRGMTDDEVKKMHQFRANQKVEKECNQVSTKLKDDKWNLISANLDRKMIADDKQMQHLQRNKNVDVSEYNKQLAAEQQRRIAFMDNVLYKNEITTDYFDQFNTTTR